MRSPQELFAPNDMNTAITATKRDLILAGPLGSLDAYIQAVGSVPSSTLR